MWHSSFDQTLSIDFGGVMGFAVRVWSWKLFQIKDPLVFGTTIRGYVNQNIVLRRIVDYRARRRVVLMTLRSTMF